MFRVFTAEVELFGRYWRRRGILKATTTASHFSSLFSQSFQSPMPWWDCPHAVGVVEDNSTALMEECEIAGPTQYFWYRDTLEITPTIQDFGSFNWKIAGCMGVAWIIIYVCIMKGIVASGKVSGTYYIFLEPSTFYVQGQCAGVGSLVSNVGLFQSLVAQASILLSNADHCRMQILSFAVQFNMKIT